MEYAVQHNIKCQAYIHTYFDAQFNICNMHVFIQKYTVCRFIKYTTYWRILAVVRNERDILECTHDNK